MGSDGGNEFYRECVDASWNGETPECGESRVFNVVIKFNLLEKLSSINNNEINSIEILNDKVDYF